MKLRGTYCTLCLIAAAAMLLMIPLGVDAPLARQWKAAVRGVTMPWTLAASCAAGAWLMFSRLTFGTSDGMANSDHFVGAMVITVAVVAMAGGWDAYVL